MFRTVAKYSAGLGLVGCGVGYLYLQKKHHHGMVPSSTTYLLNPAAKLPKRGEMIERMKREKFDLLIIGGGATGAGVALDGATRGLKCALVESDDFASGTSSRSTKLLHGGVRYLELAFKHLDISQLKLVWEALEERAHTMKSAAYMSKPVPIVMPVYRWWEVPYCWVGIKTYDLLAKLVTCFDTGLPNCFYISKSNSSFFFPLLNPSKLKGSLVYYDGQHNDSRMNLQIVQTATIPGYVEGMEPAAVANHCSVLSLIKDKQNHLIGAHVEDKISGEVFDIFCKVVVNCTGPFADSIRRMADPNCKGLISPASGTHVVLPKSYTPKGFGMIINDTSDGRVLFCLPWENSTVVGTTDSPAQLIALPRPKESEVEFILKETSRYLEVNYETMRRDVKAVWTGLRPLVKDPKCLTDPTATAGLSRSHEIVIERPSGLVSVLGGKWTTYRRMAQDAIDAIEIEYKDLIRSKKGCRTKMLKLHPSIDTTGLYKNDDANSSTGQLPVLLQEEFKISYQQASHLVSNYGFQARAICELGKKTNSLTPVMDNQPFLKSELLFVIRNEMPQKVADVIGRRLRMTFLDSQKTEGVVRLVLDIMAEELKWHSAKKEAELAEAMNFITTMNVAP